MANKNYSEFPTGTFDPAKILLQSNPTTGELEKILLSDFNLQQIITNGAALTGDVNITQGTETFNITSGSFDASENATEFILNKFSAYMSASADDFNFFAEINVTNQGIWLAAWDHGVKFNAVLGNQDLTIFHGSDPLFEFTKEGKFGIRRTDAGTNPPTAQLHIGPGANEEGAAPLKLTAGILMDYPEEGAFEFSAEGLFFTTEAGRVNITAPPSAYTYEYIAIVEQSGTSNPSPNTLRNTFPDTPSWFRLETGQYGVSITSDYYNGTNGVVFFTNASGLVTVMSIGIGDVLFEQFDAIGGDPVEGLTNFMVHIYVP
jgi:hypothetical protein